MGNTAINESTSQQSRTPEFSEKEGVPALTDESITKFFNDFPDTEKFKELYDQRLNAAMLLKKYNDNQLEGDLNGLPKTIESKNLECHKAMDTYIEGKNVDELTLLEPILNDKTQIVRKLFEKPIEQKEKGKAVLETLFLLLYNIECTCLKKKNHLVSAIEKLNTLYNVDLFETLGMHYHPDRLDEATLKRIYDAAEQVLSRFENLPALVKEKGIDLPMPTIYDETKRGGFLAIYQKLAQKMHMSDEKIGSAKIGEILLQEDPQYGTKESKYKIYANKKCEAIITQSHAILSSQTPFGIAGGVRIWYKGGSLTIGFSGRSQADDLGMGVATLFKAGLLNDETLQKIQAIAKSPYLEEKMFSLLTQD